MELLCTVIFCHCFLLFSTVGGKGLKAGGGGIEARPGTEKRCSHNLQCGPVKTWTAVFVVINISDRHSNQLIWNSNLFSKFMCILSEESKRWAANLSWNLLSVSYKGIFDRSDIDGDTSVFALSCLLQWRVDQLRVVQQSRFTCLYLEKRFATNVSKLNARIR